MLPYPTAFPLPHMMNSAITRGNCPVSERRWRGGGGSQLFPFWFFNLSVCLNKKHYDFVSVSLPFIFKNKNDYADCFENTFRISTSVGDVLWLYYVSS